MHVQMGRMDLLALQEFVQTSYCSVFLYTHSNTCLYESGHHGIKKAVDGGDLAQLVECLPGIARFNLQE